MTTPRKPAYVEDFWPPYAARRGLAITCDEIDDTTRDALGDGCQAVADHAVSDQAAEIAKHRTRLAMLLADTPFEFLPDWAGEYDDVDTGDRVPFEAPAEPQPAPELHAAMAETRAYRAHQAQIRDALLEGGQSDSARVRKAIRILRGGIEIKP